MRLGVAAFFAVTCVTHVCSSSLQNVRRLRGELPALRRTMDGDAGTGVAPSSRLAHGSPALRGQFPHQALIIAEDVYMCSGSLISGSWVLTSGFCTDQKTNFYVTLGIVNVSKSDAESTTFVSRGSITHEDFNRYTYSDDIGLIYVTVSIKFTGFVSPVPLPTFADTSSTFINQRAEISGWGKICNDEENPDILRFTEANVISNAECVSVYPSYAVPSSKICTLGAAFAGIMAHDSGDPVVVRNQHGYVQIGIASFSSTSICQDSLPSAHTRITSYLDWIQHKTGIRPSLK